MYNLYCVIRYLIIVLIYLYSYTHFTTIHSEKIWFLCFDSIFELYKKILFMQDMN